MSTTLAIKPATPAVEKMAYKLNETAAALGVSTITVRHLVGRGLLTPNRATRHLLFAREEILRFLSQ